MAACFTSAQAMQWFRCGCGSGSGSSFTVVQAKIPIKYNKNALTASWSFVPPVFTTNATSEEIRACALSPDGYVSDRIPKPQLFENVQHQLLAVDPIARIDRIRLQVRARVQEREGKKHTCVESIGWKEKCGRCFELIITSNRIHPPFRQNPIP